jgi:hypothetical protein
MYMKITKNKLQTVIDLFRSLTEELKLVHQVDGIHMWAYDPMHSMMLFIVLKKEAFNEYDPGNLEIVVDLLKIRDYLKLYKKDDNLHFEYDPENNKLVSKKDFLTRTFGLIDPEGYPEFKLAPLTLTKVLLMRSDWLLSTIERVMPKKIKKYDNDVIGFSVIPEGLNITKYDDDEHSEETIPRENIIAINSSDDKRSLYDYSMLHPVVKEIKKAFPHITMEFGYNNPMRITGETEAMRVLFLLIPRIVEEEEVSENTPRVELSELKAKPEILEISAQETAPEPEIQTPEPEPMVPIEPVIAKPESITRETSNIDIGCFVILKTRTKMIGEITGVTKTGYLIFFKGMTSKTLKEPVEIERDLVEVYRRE